MNGEKEKSLKALSCLMVMLIATIVVIVSSFNFNSIVNSEIEVQSAEIVDLLDDGDDEEELTESMIANYFGYMADVFINDFVTGHEKDNESWSLLGKDVYRYYTIVHNVLKDLNDEDRVSTINYYINLAIENYSNDVGVWCDGDEKQALVEEFANMLSYDAVVYTYESAPNWFGKIVQEVDTTELDASIANNPSKYAYPSHFEGSLNANVTVTYLDGSTAIKEVEYISDEKGRVVPINPFKEIVTFENMDNVVCNVPVYTYDREIIIPKEITNITFSSVREFTYNGNRQVPEVVYCDGLVVGDDVSFWVASGGSDNYWYISGAGEYSNLYVELQGEDAKYYTIASYAEEDVTMVINPLEVKVVLNSASFEYDSDLHDIIPVITHSSSELSENIDYVLYYEDSAGEINAKAVDAGIYNVTIELGNNYKASSDSILETQLEITKATASYSITNESPYTFNGQQIYPEINAVVTSVGNILFGEELHNWGNYVIRYEVENGEYTYDTPIDVGTYTISLESENFVFEKNTEDNHTFTIQPLEVDVVVASGATFKYDRQEHSPTVSVTSNGTDISNEEYTVEYFDSSSGSKIGGISTEVGSYLARVVLSANLTASTDSVLEEEFSISPRTLNFTIDEYSDYSYNAEPFVVPIIVVDSDGMDIETSDYTFRVNNGVEDLYNGEYPIDAGKYTIKLVPSNNFVVGIGASGYEFEIKKCKVNFTVDGTMFYYNGDSQAPSFTIETESGYAIKNYEYSIVYITDKDELDVAPSNIGEYQIKIVFGNNFYADVDSYNYSIEKIILTSDNLVINSAERPYANAEFDIRNDIMFDLDFGVIDDFTFVVYQGKNVVVPKNVGVYDVVILSIESEFYQLGETSVTKVLVVNKAQAIIVIDDDITAVYGNELNDTFVTYETISGVVYNDVNFVFTDLSDLVIGAREVEVLSYNTDCYDLDITSGLITVIPRDYTITHSLADSVYNGEYLSYAEKINLNNVLQKDLQYFQFEVYKDGNLVSDIKDAGTYTISLKENDILNYYNLTSVSSDIIFNVSKAPVSVRLHDLNARKGDSKTTADVDFELLSEYAFKNLSYYIEVNPYFVVGDEKVYEVAGLNAGNYVIDADTVDTSNNFAVSVINATLKVEIITGTIDAEDATYTYTGEAFNVSAKLMDGETELVNAQITYTYKLQQGIDGNGQPIYLDIDEIKDSGVYLVSIFASCEGYNDATKDITIIVDKVALTCGIGNVYLQYNGNAQLPTIRVMTSNNVAIQEDCYSVQISKNGVLIDEAVDAGKYYLVVVLTDENNYRFIDNSYQTDFEIETIDLVVVIGNGECFYGEDVDLSKITYTANGALIENNKYGLDFSIEQEITGVGNYVITIDDYGKYENFVLSSDFVVNGTYTVKPRVVTVEYPEVNYTYTGESLGTITPTVNNVLDTDKNSYWFKLYRNGSEVVDISSAGQYVLKIDGNEHFKKNYAVENPEFSFEVKSSGMVITIQDATFDYGDMNAVSSSIEFDSSVSNLDDLGITVEPFVEINEEKIYDFTRLDVGEYIVNADVSGNTGNYNIDVVFAKLTIAKADTYIYIADSVELGYTGEPLNIAPQLRDFDENILPNAEFVYQITKDNEAVNEIVGVGTYIVKITASCGKNYKSSEKTITVVVGRIALSVVFNIGEYYYDKISKMPGITISDSFGDNLNSICDIALYSGTEKIDYAVNAGWYRIEVSLKDGQDGYVINGQSSATFEIKPASVTINVDNVGSVYGDGLVPITYSISGNIYQGDDLGVEIDNFSETLAGVYSNIGAVCSNSNYLAVVNCGTYTISKREFAISYPSYSDLIYSGIALVLENPTLENIKSGDESQFAFVYKKGDEIVSSIISAGSYQIELVDNSFITQNYTTTSDTSVEFEVESAGNSKYEIRIDAVDESYNGEEIVIKPKLVEIASGNTVDDYDDFSIVLRYNGNVVDKIVNAGTYYVTISAYDAEIEDYIFATEVVSISPADISIAVGDYASAYGDVISLDNVDYELTSGEVYGYDDLDITFEKAEGVNAGEYQIFATCGNSNYNLVSYTTGVYTIEKKNATIIYPEYNLVYNGNTQRVDTPSVNGMVSGDSNYFKFEIIQNGSSASVKNVGTYTIRLKQNNYISSNYNILNGSLDFEVGKATITISMKDKAISNKTMISSSDLRYTVQGNYEADIVTVSPYIYFNSSKITEERMYDAGEYTISADYNCASENYNVTVKSALLTVAESANNYTLEIEDVNTIYSGNAVLLYPELYNNDEFVENVVFSYIVDGVENKEMKNAGVYNVEIIAIDGTTNEQVVKNIVVTIAKNKLTSTFDNLVFEYDKQSHAPSVTVTAQNDVSLNGVYSVVVKGVESAINAGVYVLELSLLDDVNFVFNGSSSVEFEIKARPLEIVVGSAESVYGDEISINNANYRINSGEVCVGDDLGITLTKESGENAGDYAISLDYTNKNYAINVENGIYTISKKVLNAEKVENNNFVNLQGCTDNVYNFDYDYDLLRPNNDFGDFVTYSYTNAKYVPSTVKGAGTYYLMCELKDRNNYVFENGNSIQYVKFEISKLNYELEISVNDKVYDGQEIDAPSVKVNGADLSVDLYSCKYYVNDEETTAKNAGKYTLVIVSKDSSVEFTNNEKELEIMKKALVVGIDKATSTYNREIQKPNIIVNGIVDGDDVEISVSYGNGDYISVGNYSIEVLGLVESVDVDNYSMESANFDYEITRATASFEVGKTEFVYMGRVLDVADFELDWQSDNFEVVNTDYRISSVKVLVEDEYEDSGLPINVGSYLISIEMVNDNIVLVDEPFEIVINKANITSSITLNDGQYAFDGEEKSLEVNTLELEDGTFANCQYRYNGEIEKPINVGSYEVVATITASNYNDLVLTANLTILAYRLNCVFDGDSIYTYNGLAQGKDLVGDENENIDNLIVVEYEGVDVNYKSNQKPKNCGTYKVVVSYKNEQEINIEIVNGEAQFTIGKCVLSIASDETQRVVYSGQEKEYSFELSGVVSGDDVYVCALYNNDEVKPVNVGEYSVNILKIDGDNANNYVLNADAEDFVSTLVIDKCKVVVVADSVGKIYGDEDVELTYSSNVEGVSFEGKLVRESGENVGEYDISIGDLSVGENYEIEFTPSKFTIVPRILNVIVGDREFDYSGFEIIPQIAVTNIVNGDKNVYKISYNEGSRINAGTFTVSILLNGNVNYSLPKDYEDLVFTIKKLDVSDKIVRLLTTTSVYNGKPIVPTVVIEMTTSLDYNLTYSINGNVVNRMVDAGVYDVFVEIDNANYCGSNTFGYVITKADATVPNIDFVCTSSSITIYPIENAEYSFNGGAFGGENVFENLQSNTEYSIKVKIAETTNYKGYESGAILVKTTYSLEVLGEQVEQVAEFSLEKIAYIKQLYKNYNLLSEEDKLLVDSKYEEIITAYQNYLKDVQDTNEQVVAISSVMLGGFNFIKYLLVIASAMVFGAVATTRMGGK